MRIKARALGLAARGLLQRQGAGRHRPALHRHARTAGGFLGHARQGHGVLEAGRPHLLPRQGPAVPSICWSTNSSSRKASNPFHAIVRERAGKHAPCWKRVKDYTPPEEQRLGHHRAQPRAELRAQPADEPGDRFRHPARPGRHRQDPADAGRRPDADAGKQALQRNHHDPRHRAGGRGHRLPARHRGRKDDAVDGRAGRQPRRAQQDRRRRPATGAAPRRRT